jgi:hypothetical protein
MDAPELEKLRRFCLAIGLILLTVVLAEVKIDESKAVPFAGLPLRILRPELVPVGLLVASGYSALRFWYYGFTLRRSPRKKRRQILDHFKTDDEGEYVLAKYHTPGEITELEKQIEEVFPHFPRTRPVLEQFAVGGSTTAKLRIPVRVVVAGWFEDIDYSSPVWLNLFAVALAMIRYSK